MKTNAIAVNELLGKSKAKNQSVAYTPIFKGPHVSTSASSPPIINGWLSKFPCFDR